MEIVVAGTVSKQLQPQPKGLMLQGMPSEPRGPCSRSGKALTPRAASLPPHWQNLPQKLQLLKSDLSVARKLARTKISLLCFNYLSSFRWRFFFTIVYHLEHQFDVSVSLELSSPSCMLFHAILCVNNQNRLLSVPLSILQIIIMSHSFCKKYYISIRSNYGHHLVISCELKKGFFIHKIAIILSEGIYLTNCKLNM